MERFHALRSFSTTASEAAGTRVVNALLNKRQGLNREWEALEARWHALEAKKAAAQQAHGSAEAQPDDLLRLNVGGSLMDVRRSTLTLPTGSLLAALFSDRWDRKLRRDAAGRIFIDDSPRCFEKVVSTLLAHKLSPDAPITPPKIEGHQQPYLSSMLDMYSLDSYFNKGLLGAEATAKLMGFFLGQPESLELIYRATRDGWVGQDFHRLCDGEEETLTIANTDNTSKRYGCDSGSLYVVGYTDHAWGSSSRGIYVSAPKSFVFVPHSLKHTSVKEVRDSRHEGPAFGNEMTVDFTPSAKQATVRVQATLLDRGNYHRTYTDGLTAKDIEVYRVVRSPALHTPVTMEAPVASPDEAIHQDLTAALFKTLEQEEQALRKARRDCQAAERAWEKEVTFVERFTQPDEIIKLSLSGRPVDTSLRVLRAHPDSMLATIFDREKWQTQREQLDEDGCYLLEVPADAFSKLLDNLRLRTLYGEADAPPVPVPSDDAAEYEATLTYLYPGMEATITRGEKNYV